MKKERYIKGVFLGVTLLLSGCVWRKKDNKSSSYSPIQMDVGSDSSAEGFDNDFDQEEVIEKETIFDENDNDDEIEFKVEEEPKVLSSNVFEEENNYSADIFSDIKNLKKEKIGTFHFSFARYNNFIDNKSYVNDIKNIINERYKNNNNIKIIVTGHACNFAGDERYNAHLSNQRAEKTARWIIKNTPLSESQIVWLGCGTTQLISEGNKEEQAVNRRAEIFIID